MGRKTRNWFRQGHTLQATCSSTQAYLWRPYPAQQDPSHHLKSFCGCLTADAGLGVVEPPTCRLPRACLSWHSPIAEWDRADFYCHSALKLLGRMLCWKALCYLQWVSRVLRVYPEEFRLVMVVLAHFWQTLSRCEPGIFDNGEEPACSLRYICTHSSSCCSKAHAEKAKAECRSTFSDPCRGAKTR